MEGDIYAAAQRIHPEYRWLWWKFKTIPSFCWIDLERQEEYLDYLRYKYSMPSIEEWYDEAKVAKILKKEGTSMLFAPHPPY